MATTSGMRLNRYLAAAGLGSRRACEELVRTGRVVVNGQRCENLATAVNPAVDAVEVDGQRVRAHPPLYLVVNKPTGFVTTAHDERGRPTVFDGLPADIMAARPFHVGRLDKETEGLLLLTNDGELAQRLSHPRHKVPKEYEVTLNRSFDPTLTPRLLKGVFIPIEEASPSGSDADEVGEAPRPRRLVGGRSGRPSSRGAGTGAGTGGGSRGETASRRGASVPRGPGPGLGAASAGPRRPGLRYRRAQAESVQVLTPRNKVRVVLTQGLKRQVRLMFYALGYEVKRLCRTRYGPLELRDMPVGAWRLLTEVEAIALRRATRPARAAARPGPGQPAVPPSPADRPRFPRPGGPTETPTGPV